MSSRKMPKTKAVRARLRREAEERQAQYDQLTLQQKLDRLPPAPHANRQRTRLLALLNPKSNVVASVEEANEVSTDKPKKLKAKERRAKEQS